MRKFNYEEIYLLSHGNPTRMLDYFREGKSEGPNFIVNPSALVDAFWVSDRHKAEYLGICALRSYEDYLDNGNVDLRVELIPPWVPLEVVTNNPLVQFTNNNLKVKMIKETK